MAPLTSDRDYSLKAGHQIAYGVKANTEIFKGSYIGINANGYAEPAAANLLNQKFGGIAKEHVIGGPTDGAKDILALVNEDVIVPLADATIADIGKSVYIVDSGTLTTTDPGSGVVVGRIMNVPEAGMIQLRMKFV